MAIHDTMNRKGKKNGETDIGADGPDAAHGKLLASPPLNQHGVCVCVFRVKVCCAEKNLATVVKLFLVCLFFTYFFQIKGVMDK